jgi:hypothetical protein
MKILTIKKNDIEIAIVTTTDVLITDAQSALNLLATVQYKTGCDRMILQKSALIEDFFDLKTKLAGEVLQKFINYKIKLAIVGNFSTYTSKSLTAFIDESNQWNDIIYVSSEEEAIEKLSADRRV